MAGCGCKKKNQTVNNQTVNVKLTEGSSLQEVTIMEQQLEQIIEKVEELNQQINEEQ
jgi:TolA-binding protein